MVTFSVGEKDGKNAARAEGAAPDREPAADEIAKGQKVLLDFMSALRRGDQAVPIVPDRYASTSFRGDPRKADPVWLTDLPVGSTPTSSA